jgi:hypothetical protein
MPALREPHVVATPASEVYQTAGASFNNPIVLEEASSPEGGVTITAQLNSPAASIKSEALTDVPSTPSTSTDVRPTEMLMEALLAYVNEPPSPKPERGNESLVKPEWGALPFRESHFNFELRPSIWLRRSRVVGCMQTLGLSI